MKQNTNKDNVLQDKSYAFALRVIKAYKYLCDDKKEFVLSNFIIFPEHQTTSMQYLMLSKVMK
jgi:hypothetical protein